MNGKPLGYYLQRDRNSFDILRLIFACSVIYGHSCFGADAFHSWTGFYVAGIGVKGFFFLSGLLVTNSIFARQSAMNFVIGRFFRIWPALILVVVVSYAVIGPVFTDLPQQQYFSDASSYRYIDHMLLLKSWGTQPLGYYDLPGVFVRHVTRHVNDPLWTLAPEVFAYLLILAVFLIVGANKWVATVLASAVILDAMLPQRLIFYWLSPTNEDLGFLQFSFALGVLCACWKDRIVIGPAAVIGAWMLYAMLPDPGSMYHAMAFFVCIFATSIFVATWLPIVGISLTSDISYGTYLWGFPVQQVILDWFPNPSKFWFQLCCLAGGLAFGYLSWVLIERRSIALGRRFAKIFEGKAGNLGSSYRLFRLDWR